MGKVVKLLQYAWAAPVTVFGLAYVLSFWALGWYRWYGIEGDALVWMVTGREPAWLTKLWGKFSGQAIGNVVVLKHDPSTMPWLLVHEQKHVDQVMRLGVFQPIVYAICYLAVWLGCPGSDAYFSHPFEVDARRAAGQIVDVEGAIKKLRARAKKT
jgi:hypothetical protein